MRLKGLIWTLALVLVVGLAGGAWAQEQSGGIQGVVKDSTGAVLPGVTVEARNVVSSGVLNTVTDAKGAYRFPAVPPGTYEVTAKLQGFNPARVPNVVIALGRILSVDLSLAVGGITDTVQVTGESPLIDTKQNASFTTVGQDIIDRIPKGRDFSTVVATAAGAQNESRSGGIQVDGSSGSENRFIIDGMDTTNLQGGTQGKTMLLDFIQEVQVKSSGYNAEFGGSTGGVVSAITKSGSNSMRGTIGIYDQGDWGYGARRGYHRFYPYAYNGNASSFTPEGINCQTSGLMQSLGAVPGSVATATKPAGAVVPCVGSADLLAPDNAWRYLSPVADLGGPIFKDKLWYYAGWSYAKNNYSHDAIFINDPQQTNRHFERWDYSNYLNYNATSQITNNMRVRFSGSNQKNKNRGNIPTLQPDNDPLGFAYNSNYPWIAASAPMKGYTTTTLPLVNGQLDQKTFDNTYVNNGGDSWNNSYSGNLDWVITPTLFINATAGYFFYNNTTPPEIRFNDVRYIYNQSPCGLLDAPSSLCQTTGWSNTQLTSAGTEKNIFNRVFANVNGTYFKSFAGQHTVKAGLRFERFANDVRTGLTKPQVTVFWNQDYLGSRGKYGYYELVQNGTVGNVHSNNYSIWLQDTWSVNSKLTINAGVRAENETVPSYKQAGVPDCSIAPQDPNCQMSINFGMKDKIAPRLGFAYDIKGDSKWKLYGSYSWYYDITKLELPRGSFGGDHWVTYDWTLDTYDFTSIQCGEGNTGCPGKFITSTDWRHTSNQPDPIFADYFNQPGMTGIDPNLKPVRTGDFQIGLDHELNARMSLGVRYIHKWATRTIEDTGIYAPDLGSDPTGQTLVEDYLIANPGEGLAVAMEPRFPSLVEGKTKRNYDAVELHLRKRFSNNWQADATYTYSRLYGNYPGLASSDEWGRNSPNVNRLWDNTVMSYDVNQNLVEGLLNSDRPHQFKVSGSYDFTFGLSVGANWILESGSPNNTVFRASGGGYPVFPNGRNDLGRLPMYNNLDLVLTQEIKLGGRRRLSLQANFDNVLDLKNVTNWYYQQYGSVLTYSKTNIGLPITFFYGGTTANYLPGSVNQPGAYTVSNAAYLYTLPKTAGGAYGGALWDNPFWMTPDQYQGRRQIRISAKFSF
ncbi:MAG: TonB-dependent receptor [Acidobacteria bacterium]|nr:TonB-dependent receptor [Acidobacteriota bacterium]